MDARPGLISARLAMSLDGYIADEEGSYAWIVPVPSPALDTAHQLPFEEFLASVDVVVMGRRCYDQGQHHDYIGLGKRVVVATSKPPASLPREDLVEFVGAEVIDQIRAERSSGRHCFLFGGGVLVQSFLAADAIDEMTIGVVPVLLGGGRPLFAGRYPRLDLALHDYAVRDGKVQLAYRWR